MPRFHAAETSRRKEAKELFERVYQVARERVEMNAIKAGPRNDLAWLCAEDRARGAPRFV